ncbi:MAG TPA: hypothetical protein VEU62_02030 [Bryobacterales bacterium]|nr:hypothetical protein [Bryobacterales bacterium]
MTEIRLRPPPQTQSSAGAAPAPPLGRAFPLAQVLLLSVLVGAVYFVPQALYFFERRTPQIFWEENAEEISYAVVAARAAGEHPGQPDPYRLNVPGDPQASSLSAQVFPPAALGAIARTLRLPVALVFWAGSFVFPAAIAFLFASIAWLLGLRDPALLWLAVVLSLLALPPPYWLVWTRQVAKILSGHATDFRLTLPYSRRFQPQFTAVIHYLAVAASLLALRARARLALAGALVAGVCFGLSFYCYFFSWSILLGWFVLGGVFVRIWNREKFPLWLLGGGIGAAIAAPYLDLAVRHFSSLSASAGSGRSHQIDPALRSDLLVLLLVAGLLLFCLLRQRTNRELLWAPLALNVAAGLGAVQNGITGVYIQPFHYIHYFGRPTLSFALVVLLAVALRRFGVLPRRAAAIHTAAAALIGVVVLSSLVVQWRHYQVARAAAQPVFDALPALGFLERRAVPGAAVYSPQPQVQETVALLANAVPFFSQHMWSNETAANRDAILARIAATDALDNMSEADFARLVQSRPWRMYTHYLQRIDPQAEIEIGRMERTLLTQFRAILAAERPAVLDGLRYLLLPASTPLDATRFPRYFVCRKVWSDARYSVFELEPISHG